MTRTGISLLIAAAALCVALPACNTLPTINPDLSRRETTPVKLEGPGRPLSVAQSKAVLDKLESGGKKTSIFDRHLAVEEAVVGSPLTIGNRAVLLQDGPATYAAMVAAIKAARDHINFETYIFEDDEVGRAFADLLIEKQRRGVQVNLMYDGVGGIGTPREFFKRLTDAGVAVVEYNPVNPLTARAGWNVNQRNHRKLLVVDGQVAFLGGINISSVYSGGSRVGSSSASGSASASFGQRASDRKKDEPPWRDTHLQLAGPSVEECQKLFLQTWARQNGPPLAQRKYFPTQTQRGNDVVRVIGSSPEEEYSLIYATLISAIQSAETEVLIANAYFVPDPQLISVLKAAAGRGVDVKLLLPSETDFWLVLHAGRASYDELLASGIKIYERKSALLHSKTAVIDGVWSTVGSTNLDWRSFLHNLEINAVILGSDFGTQMRTAFNRDLAESKLITLEEWRSRPIDVRFKELLGRMWEYWL